MEKKYKVCSTIEHIYSPLYPEWGGAEYFKTWEEAKAYAEQANKAEIEHMMRVNPHFIFFRRFQAFEV